MVKIKPLKLGLPPRNGVELSVLVLGYNTDATTGTIYYEVKDSEGISLADGNLTINKEQWNNGSLSSEEIENIVLTALSLERKID